MNSERLMMFEEVLKTIFGRPESAWVYLPSDRKWSPSSNAAVLQSEEVPPELEDEPDAGMPQLAKSNNLVQVLPVSIVQDIVTNARAQRRDATVDELVEAFQYYYEHDAFIDFGARG